MHIQRRPLSDFPNLEPRVRALIAQGGLSALPTSTYMLYGSAVRGLWTRENAVDINVAFCGADIFRQAAAALASVPRLSLRPDIVTGPEQLIDEADFTVCQLVYFDGAFLMSDVFFEHLAQRLLVIHRVHP